MPQECPPSQPPRLITARIRLMTSRCRTLSRSLGSWISREKRRKQCLSNFLNIFTKIRFIITPNSSLHSAWIAVQDSEILVTVRNQVSRIFDTEHGGTLSPVHKHVKFFGCTSGLLTELCIGVVCRRKSFTLLLVSCLTGCQMPSAVYDIRCRRCPTLSSSLRTSLHNSRYCLHRFIITSKGSCWCFFLCTCLLVFN